MTALTMASRLRRRAERVRSGDGDAESGFILIYVLMIITIVTVLVGGTLVIAASSVIPATRTAYDQAADAAAQSGLQNFLSTADTNCSGAAGTVAGCTMTLSGAGTVYADSSYSSKYAWTAAKAGTKYIRVTSTGTVKKGSLTSTRTLIADMAGGVSPNLTDYDYVTQYETQAPDVTQQLFPTRDIALNATAVSNADIGSGSSVHWNGASGTAAAGSVNVCNTVFYPTSTSTGRVANPPPGAPTPYVDWSETGSVGGASYTDYQPCQVSFGHSTKLLAPTSTANGLGGIRSNDAFLFSNSYPGGTGPTLNQPVITGYQYDPAVDGSCGTSGLNYRSFNLTCAGYPASGDVGGTPAAGSSLPQYNGSLPVWSTSNPTIPTGACWYQGPTRVKLNADGSGTITSPQTTLPISPSPGSCYGTSGAPDPVKGMIAVNVPNIASVSGGVLRVQNDGTAPATTPTIHTSTGWAGVNTRAPINAANSVFYASIPASGPTVTTTYVASAADGPYTPAVGDNPSTKNDSTWKPQWTSYSSGNTCSTSTVPSDLKFYSCYAGIGSTYLPTAYTSLKSTVKSALLTSPSSYTTAAAFKSLISGILNAANSSDAGHTNPDRADNRSRWWKVDVQANTSNPGCTADTTTGPVNTAVPAPIPTSTDPLFGNTAGQQSVTTHNTGACFTATVTLQVGTCSVLLALGLCVGTPVWGNGTPLLGGGTSVPQFQVTDTVNTSAVTTSSTPATSQFPIAGDVTPYAMASSSTSAPGDLYVEGTATASMALIAQNDVVITSGLGTASSSNGLEIIGQNNVRVYHPVGCVSTDPTALAATTAGFCPNDITGLYKGVLPTAARPDQQYTNLVTPANLNVTGLIFALGNAPSTVPCPRFGTNGICGGEVTTDNYNRGNALGTLMITGGTYMAHHGPLGQEWEIPATAGQSSRPYSGYQYTGQYLNLASALSAFSTILKTTSSTPFYWRIISVSTAPNPATP
jgi:hypothetical protein